MQAGLHYLQQPNAQLQFWSQCEHSFWLSQLSRSVFFLIRSGKILRAENVAYHITVGYNRKIQVISGRKDNAVEPIRKFFK